MKHIHFVFYRLKSINIIFLLTHFFIICIYLEIEFIKPLDNVKIKGKAITFIKVSFRTVFINKVSNSGIYFFIVYIFIYFILLAKCYAFAQIIVVLLV
jgi:hypothetical protein